MSQLEREQFIQRYRGDKIFHPENSPRLVEWMEGKNIPPVTVMICPTDRCNHECPLCVGGRVGVQNLQNMKGIVDQLADYGARSIVVSGGGEPLINRETPGVIEHIKNKGLDIGLITNGSIPLSEEKVVQIIQNCHWIRISIDASNPEEYLHTHGMAGDAFNKMLENVARMVEIRNKHGLINCDIGTGYLTDDITKKGMARAAEICRDIGLDFIQFRPFFHNETPVDGEFAEASRYADGRFRVLRSEYRYDKATIASKDRGGYKKCLSPHFETTIAATGKVYICCHTTGVDEYEIGDLNSSSFSEIWESDLRQRLIESISFKDCPPICKWHVLNNILYGIKSKNISAEQVLEISKERAGEVYKTVRIL